MYAGWLGLDTGPVGFNKLTRSSQCLHMIKTTVVLVQIQQVMLYIDSLR